MTARLQKKRAHCLEKNKTAGGLTADDCQVLNIEGQLLETQKKNAGGLIKDDCQVLKMSRTPCPVEDPMS